MAPGSELYSNDLFGVATALAERGIAGNPPPVVALFNGAEGDVSPAWTVQDRRNAVTLGERLANGIVDAVREARTPLGDRIAGRFEPALPLAGARVVDDHGETHQAALDARMGAAAVGGAEDGRTILFELGWREGLRGPRVPGHGPKRDLLNPIDLEPPSWLLSFLRSLGTPPPGPTTVPAGVYRLGPVALATLPGEFTTVLGRRIAAGVAAATGSNAVILVGLANEYRSYFTTAEEYDAQSYEGASTLYGPEAGAIVQHGLARVAASPASAPAARTYLYDAGVARSYGVADVGAPPVRPDDGLADVLQDLATGRPVRNAPCIVWDMPAAAWPPTRPDARVTPSVAVEAETADGSWSPLVVAGAPARDDGLDFVTVALETTAGRTRWASFWLVPPDAPTGADLRFAIDGTWRSAPFTLRDGTGRAPSCAGVAGPSPLG
jgi:neutral ceramidase